jgi:hypothetical protein
VLGTQEAPSDAPTELVFQQISVRIFVTNPDSQRLTFRRRLRVKELVFFALTLVVAGQTRGAAFYVDSGSSSPTPPYATWATAATTIQDAIDAASDGDIVLVTNGLYAIGGKVMAGDLTNRVVVDKALMVQSVNGPAVTLIQGQWDATNRIGPGAVRGAWLADGAVLSGFTVRSGATRNSGDNLTLMSGGGVWCASTNATVTNCLITGNAASVYGGGVYLGSLRNCTISTNFGAGGTAWGGGVYGGVLSRCSLIGNTARLGGGSAYATLNGCTLIANQVFFSLGGGGAGGAYAGTLNNCFLTKNFTTATSGDGGGAANATLNNCTLVANSAPYGGGASGCTVNNCILWNNSPSDLYLGTATYTCTSASPPFGAGNMAADPQLLADGFHLSPGSPCRGKGSTNYINGTDIDGQSWETQPSIGCDEWRPEPVITLKPITATGPLLGQALISAAVAGQEPFVCTWVKDGVPIVPGPHYTNTATANLLVNGIDAPDAGNYYLIASNAFGTATSPSLALSIHCVDAAAAAPSPPYTNWASAAAVLQDAVEAAMDGDWILATNGVYAVGGKLKSTPASSMTNRVALDKAVVLASMNGPAATIIEGRWHPGTTNGSTSIRCAWLTNGAILRGFTLRKGSSIGDTYSYGSGAWCASSNSLILNCTIVSNACFNNGGGVASGTLFNCVLSGNSARTYGGGAYTTVLNNCIVQSNSSFYGGGAYEGTLNNCTIVGNAGDPFNGTGGGANSSTLRNCIAYYNTSPKAPNVFVSGSGSVNYCCTTPMPSAGVGSITNAPGFADLAGGDFHLQTNSPCINSGNNFFPPPPVTPGPPGLPFILSGLDLDNNPRIVGGTADIGAYEFQFPTSTISYAWLQQFGLPTDGSTDYSDSDGDGANNFQEWLAGTVPTDSASVFRVIGIFQGTLTSVRWLGVSNRLYTVQRATNLVPPLIFQTRGTNIAGTTGTNAYSEAPPASTTVVYRVVTYR